MDRTKKYIITSTLENAIPWLVLAVVLFYCYARFFEHPYQGFRPDSTGKVIYVYANQDVLPTLQIGDQLIQLGDLFWSDFHSNLRQRLFVGVQPGDIVPIVVERQGQQISIPWKYPGITRAEVIDLIYGESWLVFIFWMAGSLALFNLRPKDDRWVLLIAFNYLTAIWLAAGSGVSFYHIWESAFVLRSGVWLSVPVYLHLHWVFPKSFRRLPPAFVWAVYLFFAALAIAEWFELPPRQLFYLGFLIATGGSLILLILHAILQPETRRDLSLLLIAAFLVLVPAIVVGVYGTFGAIQGLVIGAAGIIGLPILPVIHFYSVYRGRMGDLELRVNRAVSIYIFLILLILAMLPLGIMNGMELSVPAKLILAMIFTVLATIWGYPWIHSFVERRILGIPAPPTYLLELYSNRINTSTSLIALEKMIKDEILSSLLVRQFAFIKVNDGILKVLFTVGITGEQTPKQHHLPMLSARLGKYQAPGSSSGIDPCPWARLILPLQVNDDLIGLWLMGRRDPDDIYPRAELPVLQSLANQTAIAVSNILQTESLRAVYEADIDRHELERQRLALELHDSVLNEMAAMMMGTDLSSLPPSFQSAYQEVTQRLREIVSDLRPPMLSYGLKAGIGELAHNLMQRSKDTISVAVDIISNEQRYSADVELHLFRIAQEACENAMRHGQARNIVISGELLPQQFKLGIEDDGGGFETGRELQLEHLLAAQHFGLAGIVQRAGLIGAEVKVDSTPGAGTRILIIRKLRPVFLAIELSES
jgi:signal transduction histidine kinase